MINPEGSTGYGQRFTKDIQHNWGGLPYQTLMKGVDAILEQYPQIDPTRLAAAGASYGGYMINWINSQTNRFSCLVTHDGIFNTIGAYFTTEELWFPEFEFGGTPMDEKAKANYVKWNPMDFSTELRTPTLIIHSEKDYRLTMNEGLGLFTVLQRMNVPSRLLYFPDENHWILKPGNWLQWQREILDWMDHYTQNKPSDVLHVQ